MLKSPMIYFGGKRRAAALVWERLGDCANVIEPFCGSAAFLLARPTEPKIETLNDMCAYVANFHRAVQHDPEAVADYANDCVNETDLHARHRWLVGVEWPEPASIPPRFDRHPLVREAYLAGHRGTYATYAGAFRARMRRDPDYFDAKVAGWWIWGNACWIGSGWCAEGAEWNQTPSLRGEHGAAGQGIHASGGPARKRPLLAGAPNEHGERTHQGLGVHAKGPSEKKPRLVCGHDGHGGEGVHGKGPSDHHRPQLADAYGRGRGVHATGPGLSQRMPLASRPTGTGEGGNSRGVHAEKGPALAGIDETTLGTCAARRAWLCEWFGRLRDRLRTVRVCCGSWDRVCGSESVTTRLGLTGLYLDPPYAHDVARMHAWLKHLKGEGPEPSKGTGKASRSADLYANDRAQDVDRLVAEVHLYCLERGDDPNMRLALSGYQGEHEELEQCGWSVVAWKSSGGYANRNKDNENAARERLWFNKSCIDPEADRLPLFSGMEV